MAFDGFWTQSSLQNRQGQRGKDFLCAAVAPTEFDDDPSKTLFRTYRKLCRYFWNANGNSDLRSTACRITAAPQILIFACQHLVVAFGGVPTFTIPLLRDRPANHSAAVDQFSYRSLSAKPHTLYRLGHRRLTQPTNTPENTVSSDVAHNCNRAVREELSYPGHGSLRDQIQKRSGHPSLSMPFALLITNMKLKY